jgi:hypothetical protein
MHYFRIAQQSLKNCIYWGARYSNCKDIQTIMQDEGLCEGYRGSENEDSSDEDLSDTSSEEESTDDEEDNRPLQAAVGSGEEFDNEPLCR